MKVRDLMTTDVHTCSSSDSADRAANLMWEHDIGFIPVIDSECGIVGVVTDRDLAMAAHLRGRRLAQIPVSSIMGAKAYTCGPDDSIARAEEVMSAHQVRRLPVVQDGRLVGVLSTNDLIRAAASGWRRYASGALVQALGAIAAPRGGRHRDDTVGAPLIDLEALRTLRDDLRVRVHLARTDVLEEWERAEAKWFRMQSALSISEDDTLHAAEKAATACRRLAKEIGQGYSRVRRSLHDT